MDDMVEMLVDRRWAGAPPPPPPTGDTVTDTPAPGPGQPGAPPLSTARARQAAAAGPLPGEDGLSAFAGGLPDTAGFRPGRRPGSGAFGCRSGPGRQPVVHAYRPHETEGTASYGAARSASGPHEGVLAYPRV